MKRVNKVLRNSLVATMAMLGCIHSAWAGEAKEFEGPKPDVKIESANHKFAELYPLQYQSWAATAESKEIVSALEEDPRLVIL